MTDPTSVVKQIAFQLGLEPPGSYKPSEIARRKGRQLGRTTAMILWALVDVTRGRPVCFMAPTREQAGEIVYQARDYARQLGLDPMLIHRPVPYGVITNPKHWPKGVRVFKHHSLNHTGGPSREPRVSVSACRQGLEVDCPWCSRPIHEPNTDGYLWIEGSTRDIVCKACTYPVVVRVEQVRVRVTAWRDSAPEERRHEAQGQLDGPLQADGPGGQDRSE